MRRRGRVELEVEDGGESESETSRAATLAVLGFVGGFALGLALWSRQMRHFRRGLFSGSAVGRFAALGYLSGRPSAETARLLRDYVAWEPRSMLRRRGERVLERMQRTLDQ